MRTTFILVTVIAALIIAIGATSSILPSESVADSNPTKSQFSLSDNAEHVHDFIELDDGQMSPMQAWAFIVEENDLACFRFSVFTEFVWDCSGTKYEIDMSGTPRSIGTCSGPPYDGDTKYGTVWEPLYSTCGTVPSPSAPTVRRCGSPSCAGVFYSDSQYCTALGNTPDYYLNWR